MVQKNGTEEVFGGQQWKKDIENRQAHAEREGEEGEIDISVRE